VDLDELFGEGAELGDGVIAKAQLRFRVHPPRHPAAQDLTDRLTVAYDERLDLITSEIEDILRHARPTSIPLVLSLDCGDLAKGNQVVAPGKRGGKWYRDEGGNIRYGDEPKKKFKQQAAAEDTEPHIGHYRPSPFAGMRGIDQDLTGFLVEHGNKHDFNKNQLRFLAAWYGTIERSGALFEAFLKCAGLTREDLNQDLAQLRFGSQNLTYEEAVFEFFAAQRSLFIGDDSEFDDADEVWNCILNDEIKPLLDEVFSKYENLKLDESFRDAYAGESERQRNRFFAAARRSEASTRDIANHVTHATDPSKQVDEVIAGMRKLGLFMKPGRMDMHAHVHDRPHLKEATALDARLLIDDPERNPLLGAGERMQSLSASQLMLLYVAAELYRRWDPDTKSYSAEKQTDIGAGELGETVLEALAGKSGWGDASGLVRKHLDVLVDRLVNALNDANVGFGSEEMVSDG
jgi:hypothetical protein